MTSHQIIAEIQKLAVRRNNRIAQAIEILKMSDAQIDARRRNRNAPAMHRRSRGIQYGQQKQKAAVCQRKIEALLVQLVDRLAVES